MDFITPFNEQTKELKGTVTAHITIYDDRSMDFRVISQPTDDLIRQKLGIDKGSGKPNSEKVAKKLSQQQLMEIAEEKAKDTNTDDMEAVKKMVTGTARSMGVEIEMWNVATLSKVKELRYKYGWIYTKRLFPFRRVEKGFRETKRRNTRKLA